MIINDIKVMGRCDNPENLAGLNLKDLIESGSEQTEQTEHRRNKRSNFDTPSIYNFTSKVNNYHTIIN